MVTKSYKHVFIRLVMKTKVVTSPLIDEKVILTMIAFALTALIVLGFRYINDKPELPVSIVVKEGPMFANQSVTFVAQGQDIASQSLVWNFGDKSDKHDKGATVFHKFPAAGRYDVTLTINGRRREYKTVYIKEPPVEIPVPPIRDAKFICPDSGRVGEPVAFIDITPDATKWEWWFEGDLSASPDATDKQVKHTFNETGFKTVVLLVNGTMAGKHTILIKDKHKKQSKTENQIDDRFNTINDNTSLGTLNQQLNQNNNTQKSDSVKTIPPPHRAPDIKEEAFGLMLRQFVDDKKKVSDFSEFVCDNFLITVNINGKTGMPLKVFFEEFKKDIEESGNIKSLTITFEKNPTTNCITSINVKYKKRGWIGRKLHNNKN